MQTYKKISERLFSLVLAVTSLSSLWVLEAQEPFVGLGLFRPGIEAVGSVTDEDRERLNELVRGDHSEAQRPQGLLADERGEEVLGLDEQVVLAEQFLDSHPDSPFAAGLRDRLGSYFESTGHFSEALDQWREVELLTQDLPPGQRLHDAALSARVLTLAEQGRLTEAARLIEASSDLPRGGNSTGRWRRAQAIIARGTADADSRRRGIEILLEAVGVDGARAMLEPGAAADPAVAQDPSPFAAGISLSEMAKLMNQERESFRVAQGNGDWSPMVPSVLQLRLGAFVAVTAAEGDGFRVSNPAAGRPRWYSADALRAEASGYAIVPADAPEAAWASVSSATASSIEALPSDCPPFDDEDANFCLDEALGCLPARPSDGPNCELQPGMATWRVSEPFLNVWIEDMPLEYVPPRGPAVRLILSCRQRLGDDWGYYPGSQFGHGVHASWRSSAGAFGGLTYFVYHPNGRMAYYEFETSSATLSERNYWDNSRLERLFVNGQNTGYALHRPDGSQLRYEHNVGGDFFLSQKVDPQGFALTFGYDGADRLISVSDAGGQQTHLFYQGSSMLVHAIQAPGGRIVQLGYTTGWGGDAYLSQITDPVGVVSELAYHEGWVSSLKTPYGETTFEAGPASSGSLNRWVKVTEPGDLTHMYALIDTDAPRMPSEFRADQVPQPSFASTLDLGYRQHRNTFYWNPLQWSTLEEKNLSQMDWDEYKQARIRHWLWEEQRHLDSLSYEQGPSPDGTIEGPILFYDYADKPAPYRTGSQIQPSVIAWLTGEGETAYARFDRNELGKVNNKRESFLESDGTVGERERRFEYGPDGIDLLSMTNWKGDLIRTWVYNADHQVTRVTEHLDSTQFRTTNISYNYLKQVSRINTSTLGDIRFYYDSQGYLIRRSTYPGGLENFTWENGNLVTYQDPRYATRKFTYDGLNRVTRIDHGRLYYSSNLFGSEEFRYTMNGEVSGSPGMDLTYHKNREGDVTRYQYNARRQLTRTTDALNRDTHYSYCDCGALESVTNALGETTTLARQQNGRVTEIQGPSNTYTLAYNYDLSGNLIRVDDGLTERRFRYDHQGRLIGTASPAGPLDTRHYDEDGNLMQTTNADGETWSMSYDRSGRLTSETAPGGSVSRWVYRPNGLETAIDPLRQRTTYIRDAWGRPAIITEPSGLRQIRSYGPGGELRSIIDNNETVRWSHDPLGRVIERRNSQNFVTDSYTYNKRDQLTKWTTRISSIGASYEYDRVGNLIKMKSGSGTPEIDYEYDALNRLVEMTDASGVTQFAYTADGRLKTEDGPWSNDTVEWGYEHGYRRSLAIGDSQNSQNAWQQDYAYDPSGRLATIENPVGNFDYAYFHGSAKRQWQELSYPSGSRVRRQFDTLGRQTRTELRTSSGSVLNAHAYSYDPAHRRTRHTLTHGNYWQYTYDGLGQLTSAKGYESNQTPRIHEQLNYTYRSSGMRGNLNTRTRNGRTTGFIYLNTDNGLYQASVREPAYVTVSGLTAPPATSVTVNGNPATVYQDGSYARADEDLARDGANQRIDIVATGPDGERRRKRLDYDTPLPAANMYQSNRINFRLDGSGNMIQVGNNNTPGTRYYQYDGYRQLTHVYEANRWRTEYVYDGLNRQRVRKRFRNEGGNWVLSEERRYLYDGRQVIQERDENNLPLVTYTRGLDLSESLDGAGGIGGLLAYTEHQSDQLRTAYYHADANGNITAMINRHDRLVAQYQYDPFGNLLAQIGPLSEANPYRFSSKQFQPDSGLYAYGFRFYDPSLQRWINQDPIGEAGGINLYGFVGNDPVNFVDRWGLEKYSNIGMLDEELGSELQGSASRSAETLRRIVEFTPADDLSQIVTGKNLRDEDVHWWQRVIAAAGFFTCLDELNDARKASKGTNRLLEQFNSVEGLLDNAGQFKKLKGGIRQATIRGDGESIFKAITRGGKQLENGAFRLVDGTFVNRHFSTKTGEFTIDINRTGKKYKIRINQ